jgi:hypothetical protein
VSLASLVAWAMLAVLIGWLGIVLVATYFQVDGETREAARRNGDKER